MTNFLSTAEQKIVGDLKGVYGTLTADAKKAIAKIAQADMGLMGRYPIRYTLVAMGAGALLIEIGRLLIGHP